MNTSRNPRNNPRNNSAQPTWRIFRWPLVMAAANAIGLVAALVGDGWYDVVSCTTLGLTLVVMCVAFKGVAHE